jgi:5-methylcytosine-specific restriction endonuclease McrA
MLAAMVRRRKKAQRPAGRAGVPAALRDAVHLRDDFTCVYCGATGRPRRSVVITIDHVVPIHFGGRHEASNLVTACDLCNWMKGIYPLDLWTQLAERLGYGDALVIQRRVQAALARKLPRMR